MRVEHLVIAALVVLGVVAIVLFSQADRLPDLGTEQGVTCERQSLQDFNIAHRQLLKRVGLTSFGSCVNVVAENLIEGEATPFIRNDNLRKIVRNSLLATDTVDLLTIITGRGPFAYELLAIDGASVLDSEALPLLVAAYSVGAAEQLEDVQGYLVYIVRKETQ